MKRLITEKKHEIQDARLVAEYNNGLDSSDPEAYFEELYLKKTGGYFLYGRGGISSKWANDEGPKTLSVEEAQAWVNKHTNDKNYYTDLWGEAEE